MAMRNQAQEIRTKRVKVSNGNPCFGTNSSQSLQIDAYLAEPIAPGPWPAVVVIQEVFGVNGHIRSVVKRLAHIGYVAIAPAIYQRTAPGFEVGYSPEELALGRRYKELTTAEELLSDLRATIAYLQTLRTVQPEAIGAIGFCFGGHVAYLAATLPEIQATASFYGAGIAVTTPGGGEPTIARTPEIQGTLYAFFGTEDPLIPREQIDQIEAALRNHQIQHQVFRYSVGHGFFCEARSDYNAEAAADAWERVQELFRTLG